MKYKRIVLGVTSLLLVAGLILSVPKPAQAACKCVQVAGADGKYDSNGDLIPREALGVWDTSGDEPYCPGYVVVSGTPGTPATSGYGPGVRSSPTEGGDCNVFTQTYFNTPFKVPTLGDLLGNVIRLFFFIAAIYALFLLLLGGFEWVSSGGDDKKLTAARQKILNAIIGLVVMVAVLTLVIIIEQVVFGGKVCLGVSCPINLGGIAIVK